MWKDRTFNPSPSRTYVAVCYKVHFDGHYFRKFFLPFHGKPQGIQQHDGWSEGSFSSVYDNTCTDASSYFTTTLNPAANIECCIPWEQYLDLKDQDELNRRNQDDLNQFFPKEAATAKTVHALKECVVED